MSNTYCFDLETNGCKFAPSVLSQSHHIIQIAVMHVSTRLTFKSYVRLPDGVAIPQESSDIHGIYESDIEKSPHWKTVFYELKSWVTKTSRGTTPIVFIAHNCHGFDELVLRKECISSRRHVPHDWWFFDSLPLMKHLYPHRANLAFDRRYNLSALHKDIVGSDLSDAHDAMADVTGLVAVLTMSGAFNGSIRFDNVTEIGYRKDPPDMRNPITSLRGIGEHTSRLIAKALYKSSVTVQDLCIFVSHHNIQEIEHFLRTILTHEKHVLSLTMTLWKLVHHIDINTEIELIDQFPFTQDGRSFYNIFSTSSMIQLQQRGFRGVLDLCVQDKFSHNIDVTGVLVDAGCSTLEIQKYINKYTYVL